MVNRLTIVEMQGIPGTTKDNIAHGRSEALRGLLAALRGLIFTANNYDKDHDNNDAGPELNGKSARNDPQFRRTRVPPDIWHDTLSLLCDKDIAVRGDYADLLVFYLTEEMPKLGDVTSSDAVRNARRSAEGPLLHATTMNVVLHGGDVVMKVINAIHAYLYILSLASSLGLDPNSTTSNFPSTSSPRLDTTTQSDPNYLLTQQAPRLRKVSKVQKLTERVSQTVSNSCSAYMDDYVRMLRILTTIHEQTPVRGLFAGIPMLLALDASTKTGNTENSKTAQRISTIKEVIAKVWRVLGKVWDSAELVGIAENVRSRPKPIYEATTFFFLQALSSMPRISTVQDIDAASPHDLRQPTDFSDRNYNAAGCQWAGVDSGAALRLISNCRNVQRATGLGTDVLLGRFTSKWSVDAILKDCMYFFSFR